MAKSNTICKHCNEEILPDDYRVSWKEWKAKPIEVYLELDFHKNCWMEHYNESLDKKVQKMAKQIFKNAQPLIKEYAQKGGLSI